MTVEYLLELLTHPAWEVALPWLGVAAYAMLSVFRIVDRDHFAGKDMIVRHAKLASEETGYVAAFMARNGIQITVGIFVLGSIWDLELAGFMAEVRSGVTLFVGAHLLFNAVMVYLVAGAILRNYHDRPE